MDTWTKVGTVAAVVAAAAAILSVAVGWIYGRRAVGDARKAVTYDRLREARELVGTIRRTADNSRWSEAAEACAQLRTVVLALDSDVPETRRLYETSWNLDTYMSDGLQGSADAARAELADATKELLAGRERARTRS